MKTFISLLAWCTLCIGCIGCTSGGSGSSSNDANDNSGGKVSEPPVDAAVVGQNLTPQQKAVGDVETNSIGMVLVPIPPGEFKMSWAIAGQPTVVLDQPYYITATEVTQSQWKAVMGTTPWTQPSMFESGEQFPANNILWEEAVEFCQKLSEKEKVEYRLPTEAEWEYACRAGTTTFFSFGKDQNALENYGWYRGNAYSKVAKNIWTRRVARKEPNPWGLYDMHGNVEEMCLDYWANELPSGKLVNPTGPKIGDERVRRGGSIRSDAENCRSPYREPLPLDIKADDLGFRVVRVIKQD